MLVCCVALFAVVFADKDKDKDKKDKKDDGKIFFKLCNKKLDGNLNYVF